MTLFVTTPSASAPWLWRAGGTPQPSMTYSGRDWQPLFRIHRTCHTDRQQGQHAPTATKQRTHGSRENTTGLAAFLQIGAVAAPSFSVGGRGGAHAAGRSWANTGRAPETTTGRSMLLLWKVSSSCRCLPSQELHGGESIPEFPDLSSVPSCYYRLREVFNIKKAMSSSPHRLYDCAIEPFQALKLPRPVCTRFQGQKRRP